MNILQQNIVTLNSSIIEMYYICDYLLLSGFVNLVDDNNCIISNSLCLYDVTNIIPMSHE